MSNPLGERHTACIRCKENFASAIDSTVTTCIRCFISLAIEGLKKSQEVLLAYEGWEAEVIECDKCWSDGSTLTLTEELYEKMMHIQAARNEAKKKVQEALRL